jgi:hypothetical protein
MILAAASLSVASLLHLSGFAHGQARPLTATGDFQPGGTAGISLTGQVGGKGRRRHGHGLAGHAGPRVAVDSLRCSGLSTDA